MNNHEAIKKYIEALYKDLSSCLIVLGKAGIGKTETTLLKMKQLGLEEGKHYFYITNYISPLSLFLKLQEVNMLESPRMLILDDAEAILKHKETAGILRSALWETPDGKRKVCWVSSAVKRSSKEFYFEGKVIMLLNELNTKNPVLEALADRALFYNFQLSPQEITELIRKRAREWNDNSVSLDKRLEIAEYLIKVGGERVSLRSLKKAIQMFLVSPNHWKPLLEKIL